MTSAWNAAREAVSDLIYFLSVATVLLAALLLSVSGSLLLMLLCQPGAAGRLVRWGSEFAKNAALHLFYLAAGNARAAERHRRAARSALRG